MNWTPKVPKLKWPNLVLHIPSMPVWYGLYALAVVLYVRFGHGFVVKMFENIPDTTVTVAYVAAVVVFVALIAILSEFVSNKKDEATKAKEAKLNAEVYDAEVNGKISQKFFWGYAILGIVGAGLVTLIVMLAVNELETTQYAAYVNSPIRAGVVGAIASLIALAIVDKYLLRSAMDGVFYKAVEEKAINDFLTGNVADSAAAKAVMSAKEKYDAFIAAGMTVEEALASLKQQ